MFSMRRSEAMRTIIRIDQELCNGCGACETGCPEGALKIIDGKARLVGESLCDGLGACIGHCPQGAIQTIQTEAEAYDEYAVMAKIAPQGESVIHAHLAHLEHFGQDVYIKQALDYLEKHALPLPEGYSGLKARLEPKKPAFSKPCSPAVLPIKASKTPVSAQAGTTSGTPSGQSTGGKAFPEKPSAPSALSHWPVQLHLINPRTSSFSQADVVIAADCTAFALGSFHTDILKDAPLVIACPKLDSGRDIYLSKLASIISQAKSVRVVVMEVPCCSGLLRLVREARSISGRSIPIHSLVVGIDGGFVAQNSD